MRHATVILILLVLSSLSVVMAQAPPAASIREAELSEHPFDVGSLRLTVEKLAVEKIWHRQYVQIQVENQTDTAVPFEPQLLSLLNSDSEQVDVMGLHGEWYPTTKALPGAVLKKGYWLDRKVKFPARLYYDGKELALVTN